MKTFTLDNMRVDEATGLYDMFQTTVVDNKDIPYTTVMVEPGEGGRMDKVSDRLYGTDEYVEEICILNNILNKWSVKVGDVLKVVDRKSLDMLHQLDKTAEEKANKTKLVNPNKNTKKDPSRSGGLTPVVMPLNKKSIDINKNDAKITIMNSFD